MKTSLVFLRDLRKLYYRLKKDGLDARILFDRTYLLLSTVVKYMEHWPPAAKEQAKISLDTLLRVAEEVAKLASQRDGSLGKVYRDIAQLRWHFENIHWLSASVEEDNKPRLRLIRGGEGESEDKGEK